MLAANMHLLVNLPNSSDTSCTVNFEGFSENDFSGDFSEDEPDFQSVISASTPLRRRAVSLTDIRSDPGIQKSLIGLGRSTDTIVTNSSFTKSKDSGYNCTSSLLSIDEDRCSEQVSDVYTAPNEYLFEDLPESLTNLPAEELLKELYFNRVLIKTLQEKNNHLKLMNAAAENKISELRLLSEKHCDCCSRMNDLPRKSRSQEDTGVHPLFKAMYRFDEKAQGDVIDKFPTGHKNRLYTDSYSTPCSPGRPTSPSRPSSAASTPAYATSFSPHPKVNFFRDSMCSNLFEQKQLNLPSDDSNSKVKRWQDSLASCGDSTGVDSHCAIPEDKTGVNIANHYTELHKYPISLPRVSHPTTFQVIGDKYITVHPKNPDKLAEHQKEYNLLDLQVTEYKQMMEQRIRERLKDMECKEKQFQSLQEKGSADIEQNCGLVGHMLSAQAKHHSELLQCIKDAEEYVTTVHKGLTELPSQLEGMKYKSWV